MLIMLKLIAFYGLFAIASISGQRLFRQVQQCTTPDNYIGACVVLSDCPFLGSLFGENGGSRNVIQYLYGVQRSCGVRSIDGDPVVCCTRPISQPNKPTQPPFTQQPTFETSFFPTTSSFRPPSFPPTISTTTTTTTTTESSLNLKNGKTCTNYDGRQGNCIALTDCQEYVDRYNSDKSFAREIQRSIKACGMPQPIICCPAKSLVVNTRPPVVRPTTPVTNLQYRLPTPQEGCGISNTTFKKIVGGAPAKIGAWPWLTLIGYTDSFGTISFKCGGALITQKHVLTAAHCIRTDLKFVRLGEHNLNIEDESTYYDIDVNKIYKNENYDSRDGHSDIAVLRLAFESPNTDRIHPACLPNTPELRARSFVRHSPFVAGWGKTQEGGKSSQVLQELQIPVLENEDCRERYQRRNRLQSARQFDNAVICAGVLSGGKDTCQGDSGGPLMIPIQMDGVSHFYVIGVVSYGIGCARPDVPGVYTNVAVFMDWIQDKLRDTSS